MARRFHRHDLTDSWEMLLQTKPMAISSTVLARQRSNVAEHLEHGARNLCLSMLVRSRSARLRAAAQKQAAQSSGRPNQPRQTDAAGGFHGCRCDATRGVGPCGTFSISKGKRPVQGPGDLRRKRDKLTPIYASNQQSQKRAEVDKTLTRD
jgi:hypothetical protein